MLTGGGGNLSRQHPGAAPRFFFGWYIVGFTFVAQFAVMGTLFYAYGVLLKPLVETFAVDRFYISLATSIQGVIVAFISPYIGKLIGQMPIRRLMWCGAGALCLGFVGMGQAQNVLHLYLTFGVVLALAMALLGVLPNNALLANWFVKRRGKALGLSQLGISLSGAAMVPLTAWLVEIYGWRTAVTLFGLGFAALLAPLIWKFAVNRPEDRGLMPDGAVGGAEEDSQFGSAADWSLLILMRQWRTWQLMAVVGPSFTCIGGVLLVLPSHITDLGLTTIQASFLVVIATLMAALAKPLFGMLSDFVDKRAMMAVSLLCQITGVTLLLTFANYPGLAAAAVFFGLGYGAVTPLWTLLLAALYGRAAFARILGLMAPLTSPFIWVGMPLSAWAYDATGSYAPAFAGLILALLGSMVAVALLRLPGGAAANVGKVGRAEERLKPLGDPLGARRQSQAGEKT